MTGATIDGRALARNGAVTLDTNTPTPTPTPTPTRSVIGVVDSLPPTDTRRGELAGTTPAMPYAVLILAVLSVMLVTTVTLIRLGRPTS